MNKEKKGEKPELFEHFERVAIDQIERGTANDPDLAKLLKASERVPLDCLHAAVGQGNALQVLNFMNSSFCVIKSKVIVRIRTKIKIFFSTFAFFFILLLLSTVIIIAAVIIIIRGLFNSVRFYIQAISNE